MSKRIEAFDVSDVAVPAPRLQYRPKVPVLRARDTVVEAEPVVHRVDVGALERKLAQLEKELADERAAREEQARANAPRPLTFKVSEKGCVSVYGLMRFPLSLYPSAWMKLLGASAEVKAFLDAELAAGRITLKKGE